MRDHEILSSHPPSDLKQIWNALKLIPGVNLDHYKVDIDDFHKYLENAKYPLLYRKTFGELFLEKALEHYTSLKLLNYGDNGISIDIASATSPFHGIISKFYSCKSYRQDIIYPSGVNASKIGGNATELPFEENTINWMTLHCSIEHFENNEDSEFIVEAIKKLNIGGKLFIAPLYLSEVYYNYTDPELKESSVSFDMNAKLLFIPGWNNRFGRTYDVDALQNRILAYCKDVKVNIFLIENLKDVCDKCYLNFIFILEK